MMCLYLLIGLVYLNMILLKDGAQGGSPNLCHVIEVLHKDELLMSHMSDMSLSHVFRSICPVSISKCCKVLVHFARHNDGGHFHHNSLKLCMQ